MICTDMHWICVHVCPSAYDIGSECDSPLRQLGTK